MPLVRSYTVIASSTSGRQVAHSAAASRSFSSTRAPHRSHRMASGRNGRAVAAAAQLARRGAAGAGPASRTGASSALGVGAGEAGRSRIRRSTRHPSASKTARQEDAGAALGVADSVGPILRRARLPSGSTTPRQDISGVNSLVCSGVNFRPSSNEELCQPTIPSILARYRPDSVAERSDHRFLGLRLCCRWRRRTSVT